MSFSSRDTQRYSALSPTPDTLQRTLDTAALQGDRVAGAEVVVLGKVLLEQDLVRTLGQPPGRDEHPVERGLPAVRE